MDRNKFIYICRKYKSKNILVYIYIKMENYVNYTLLKNTRNLILAETDKYLLPDYPITSEQLEIVKNYRKSLRDFTNNNYIMPDKPDFVITLN